MSVIDQLGLREDPFGPACGATGMGIARPVAETVERVVAAVRRADPLVVLVGRPGMGKTLALSLIEDRCQADGLDTCIVARGDMAHTALGSGAQLIVIDEADTINTATLKALAPGQVAAAAPTMVFAMAQPALHRLAGEVRTTVVELRPLRPDEARSFLLDRAARSGRPDLFASDALDAIIDAARGSPRLLRVLAGAAMFQAALDAAPQITLAHASLAATMHGGFLGAAPAAPTLPPAANDIGGSPDEGIKSPLSMTAARRTGDRDGRQRLGVLSFAATVALAALVLPVFLAPEPAERPVGGPPAAAAGAMVAGPVRLAASAFSIAPANAAGSDTPFAMRLSGAGGTLSLPALIAAPGRPSSTAMTTGAGNSAVPSTRAAAPIVYRAIMAGRQMPTIDGAARVALIDLLGATRPRALVASRGRSQAESSDDQAPAAFSVATPSVTLALAADSVVPPTMAASVPAMTMDGAPIVVAKATAETAKGARTPAQAVHVTPVGLPTASVRDAAEAVRLTRSSVKETTSTKQAVEVAQTARLAAVQSRQTTGEVQATRLVAQQARDSAGEARAARQVADQAKATKDVARQVATVKASIEESRAAKLAADQAKGAADAAKQAAAAREVVAQAQAAKVAADQARSAKEAAEQGRAAKAAAEQAKAAKDAADQAKAARDAADQAKAAKAAADQAKAAKDAADQAKAAKDAADQAKAAKEAADQAKAAKEAAEQAKAAKDAADQAKAAKEAAEQAKAAKEAAEQAKAAKDAAEQAKAAKDAADQAKAAKDAADQAKAAKDAAEQAKAAKAAADQAKAAKDAVEQAKAARDAAKAAKDNVKAVTDAVKGT